MAICPWWRAVWPLLTTFWLFVGPSTILAHASNRVEVIVDPLLYAGGEITEGLDRYLDDLAVQGYCPTLTTTPFADPVALRDHLTDSYLSQGLAGAVFVGDLPIAYYERDGQFGDPDDYQRFPCDLYYTDLNGRWLDLDESGTYDTHLDQVCPEIWLGRMTVSPLVDLHPGRTEAGLLNNYLDKNHAYRRGLNRLPENGLAYIDDDWAPWANAWGNLMAVSVGGEVDVIKNGATTTAADWKTRISPEQTDGYEAVLLAAHSSDHHHVFKIGDELTGGSVLNSDLADVDPQAFFYNLYCCSNANFAAPGYMGGEYVFGEGEGLLAVGSTKTGGMWETSDYYNPLADGDTFGEAFLNWWQDELEYGSGSHEQDWFYGMTLLGDPLLLPQKFVALAGDLNGDGFVGSEDLDIVRTYWGQDVTPGDYLAGDPSGDGFVGGDDLDIVRAQWGMDGPMRLAPPTAVPEPGATSLLMAVALSFLASRGGRGK